jgi:ADP-dependent NAD(P)H-hydrate dehydratase / NAD(P)H-hydrate epimerase
MKILSVEKIREADEFTIKNEPISDIDLMERAAGECFNWLVTNIAQDKKLKIFAGIGNNGGDGLAIARMMALKGYKPEVFILGTEEQMSGSCRVNFARFRQIQDAGFKMLDKNKSLPVINPEKDVVIDAIFGSGLTRDVSGFQAKVIEHINSSKVPVIAIDVPSGLFCDRTMQGSKKPVVIKASHTLTFSPPKLAFFFPENDPYIGKWHLLDIGIMEEFIKNADTQNFFTGREDVRRIVKPRNMYAHKGNFGHALLFCGSRGKMGAAVLAARACLRSGPGLVTVHIPSEGAQVLQTAIPEAMLSIDPSPAIFSEVPDLTPFNSIAAGPGLGQDKQTAKALKLLIQNAKQPIIFDADAINILGENKTWISFVPKGSIFTPHPREFERLAGKSSDHFDRNRLQREFSFRFGVYVVLKGAHTAITTPEGNCYFNPTGNPGMATGGSGDVLTGIIAGFLARGYTSLESCILGAYIHGLAGDLAAADRGEEALIAGDIIENMGKAFKSLATDETGINQVNV